MSLLGILESENPYRRNNDLLEAKRVLKRESSEMALLIGNGINRVAGASGGLSWDQLIVNLISEASNTSPDPGATERRLRRLLETGETGQTPASLPEAFDIIDAARIARSKTSQGFGPRVNLQRKIVQLLREMRPGAPHKAVAKWSANFRVPLLTTNYDHCFQNALADSACKRRRYGVGIPMSDIYPWDRYYAAKIISEPAQEFGIWHIHGDQELERSIRAGLDQYMGMVERLRKLKLRVAKEILVGESEAQSTPAFHSAPWLRIFMGKKLWIQGLGIRSAEVSIRWLLIQRFRYWNRFKPEEHQTGWYIHGPGKETGPLDRERRIFFESVGLKIITIKNSDDSYINLFEA